MINLTVVVQFFACLFAALLVIAVVGWAMEKPKRRRRSDRGGFNAQ